MAKCPKCGREVDSSYSFCPSCGAYVPPFVPDYVSSAASISGAIFEVSSVTAVTPSFTKIASMYDDDPDAQISEDQFLRVKIDPDILEYYVKLGYLKRLPSGRFELTDLGKEVYQKNKVFRKRVEENIDKIDI